MHSMARFSGISALLRKSSHLKSTGTGGRKDCCRSLSLHRTACNGKFCFCSVPYGQPQVTFLPRKSESPPPAAGKREQSCQLIIIQEQSRPFILAGSEPFSPQDARSSLCWLYLPTLLLSSILKECVVLLAGVRQKRMRERNVLQQ